MRVTARCYRGLAHKPAPRTRECLWMHSRHIVLSAKPRLSCKICFAMFSTTLLIRRPSPVRHPFVAPGVYWPKPSSTGRLSTPLWQTIGENDSRSHYADTSTPALFERIPPDCLLEFKWTWERGHPIPSVLDSPAVRATRCVELQGRLYTMDSVRSILELPFLERMSLELKGDERGCLVNVTPTKLRHLHLIAQGGYSRAVDMLLSAVGPRLESLRLVCGLGDDSERDGRLVSCLATHCPDLKRLEIEAIASPQAPVPFAGALVRQCRSLEYLRCTEGTFTSALFQDIPPSVRVLALAIAPALNAPLLEFLQAAAPGRGGLATLELIGDADSECNRCIEDACSKRGLRFRLCPG
ncbi:hypothetical protein BV20DRAFT_254106 [Pilatotrama ljubarskyi]|nr:hypothetical protein BV20DRAFT_254106 [Pilatotrama ljubarskyi]